MQIPCKLYPPPKKGRESVQNLYVDICVAFQRGKAAHAPACRFPSGPVGPHLRGLQPVEFKQYMSVLSSSL